MIDMQHLHNHWQNTWNALQATAPAGLYEQLIEAYCEPQRHYHTLQHLEECLQLHAKAEHLASSPQEIAVALWFHDAVYDVRAHNNEVRSADWVVTALQLAGVSAEVQARVHTLIMATQHTAVPTAGDAAYLVDVDLAILGAPPARFAQYEQQIQQEYAWVPQAIFRTKRHAVLQGFLARPRIYSTPFFAQQLEASARANLQKALQATTPI